MLYESLVYDSEGKLANLPTRLAGAHALLDERDYRRCSMLLDNTQQRLHRFLRKSLGIRKGNR